MLKKFGETDILIVADLKGKPVYIGGIFNEAVHLEDNRSIQKIEKDGLTCHFISLASASLLSMLRERRDEIMATKEEGTETIKFFSEPEINSCSALLIHDDKTVELIGKIENQLPPGFGADPF